MSLLHVTCTVVITINYAWLHAINSKSNPNPNLNPLLSSSLLLLNTQMYNYTVTQTP